MVFRAAGNVGTHGGARAGRDKALAMMDSGDLVSDLTT